MIDIESILADEKLVETAYVEIRTMQEISMQMGMNGIEPDAYEGLHYSKGEGSRVIQAYAGQKVGDGSVKRVNEFWDIRQHVVQEIYKANPLE